MMPTPGGLVAHAVWRRLFPGQRTIDPGADAFETDWLCGAVFLIRTALFREVGMMDPRYFLYFEETDLW